MQPIEVGNIYRRKKKIVNGSRYIMCLPDNRWRYFDYPECPYYVHSPEFKPEGILGYEFIHKKYIPQVGDICVGGKHEAYRLVINTRFSESKQLFEIETYLVDENYILGNKPFWWAYDEFIQKFEFVCNQEEINCFVPGAICSWHMSTPTGGFDDIPVNHYLITGVKEDVSSDKEYKYYIVWLEENTPETPKYPHIIEEWITEGRFRYIQHMDDVMKE